MTKNTPVNACIALSCVALTVQYCYYYIAQPDIFGELKPTSVLMSNYFRDEPKDEYNITVYSFSVRLIRSTYQVNYQQIC